MTICELYDNMLFQAYFLILSVFNEYCFYQLISPAHYIKPLYSSVLHSQFLWHYWCISCSEILFKPAVKMSSRCVMVDLPISYVAVTYLKQLQASCVIWAIYMEQLSCTTTSSFCASVFSFFPLVHTIQFLLGFNQILLLISLSSEGSVSSLSF